MGIFQEPLLNMSKKQRLFKYGRQKSKLGKNMPTIKNAKTKVEEEAKKISADAKKAGGKVTE
jgi:hypothetical protein